MTEEKEKQEELNPIEIIVKNDTSNVEEETEISIPLLDLSINDLILKMVEFSNKENCLTVSKDAEEVRSIYLGTSEERAIRGVTSDEEAADLEEDGIPFVKIPWVDKTDN